MVNDRSRIARRFRKKGIASGIRQLFESILQDKPVFEFLAINDCSAYGKMKATRNVENTSPKPWSFFCHEDKKEDKTMLLDAIKCDLRAYRFGI